MSDYKTGLEVLHNGEYYVISQIITWLGHNKRIFRLRRYDHKKCKEIIIDVAEKNINKKIPKKKKPIIVVTRTSIYDLLESDQNV